MFSDSVVLILQQLSYIVIIFTGPAVTFLAVKLIILSTNFDNHIEDDKLKHVTINDHLGKHDSKIHDLEMDSAMRKGKFDHLGIS